MLFKLKLTVFFICCLQVFCLASKLDFLEGGEIQPSGWIKEQMHLDLEEGYYARYDEVNHTVTHNLFVKKDRISGERYHGLKCWWSGEHEGYWKDGVLRMAFLSGHNAFKQKAIAWLDEIVEAQKRYIGIYKAGDEPNTRFNHTGLNGELWTQSRIFQALIAGYEFTGEQKYFKAVKKAVDLTIAEDPGNYFNAKQGGASHGVGFFDTLWYLYNNTGDKKYAAYAVKLYEDFNSGTPRDDDLKTDILLSDKYFQRHGAHIAEGFFVPRFIASLTDDAKYDKAADRAVEKLKYHLTPSGAMVCAENVKGNPGTAEAGYEYCGIAELVQSLTKLVALTGKAEIAEIAESMTFNAGQGVRLPVLKAVAYLSTDNRIAASPEGHGQRYAYASFHGAAACCSLNAGRLMPYYVEGMWMRSQNGLTAQLLGPCTVDTDVKGTKVQIKELTAYPFSDKLEFEVSPAKPVEFVLSLRIPEKAEGVKIAGLKNFRRKGDYLIISRTWESGDSFAVSFDFPIEITQDKPDSQFYIQRGPLVYALPIEHQMTKLPTNGKVYDTKAKERKGWNYKLPHKPNFSFEKIQGDYIHPWAKPTVQLSGVMLDKKGRPVNVNLKPIGATVLRRTSFPLATQGN
ncbi:hypothetical protein L21SP3_01238 [Sedimentisphaera cyanobacteriorum]|uniref:Non-reducing end beta-L-arabinofuranosidase n=1 Tax=Sedimentisphaera cyanobacteriorum TaxID=1940790 RepID=A0A1Q2HQB1_9BACT|nr:beta-L-arabinofuranosidase domain-containing protein [Sedimentisphaera cyanobacteriorum]AQQ09433.1 hypothetical protein L21SP3_01238 [Sedimentisphaera cyanobacteriorum]